jgi:hypothetical protein
MDEHKRLEARKVPHKPAPFANIELGRDFHRPHAGAHTRRRMAGRAARTCSHASEPPRSASTCDPNKRSFRTPWLLSAMARALKCQESAGDFGGAAKNVVIRGFHRLTGRFCRAGFPIRRRPIALEPCRVSMIELSEHRPSNCFPVGQRDRGFFLAWATLMAMDYEE